MGNPLESAARSFFESNKKNIPDLDKYLGIVNSSEGRKLLSAISDKGGDTMKQTAAQAASGDAAAVKQLVSQLLTSKEGRDLAKHVMDIYKK